MSDVFISYSRKDKAFVQILHNALEASNRETWVDWENIPKGTEWWQQIEAGIEGANTFIFVISPDSVDSSVCGDEINHAIKNGKRFLPIVRRDVEFSQFEDINPSHRELKAHNWLFFREEDIFEQSFADLVISLETDVEYVQQHTEFLREALKWEHNKRNDSFLLQGDALTEAERWLVDAEQRLEKARLAEDNVKKKDPNPLLTEQQRNFIHKSRESEDAKARAKLILQRVVIFCAFLLAVSLVGAVGAYKYAQGQKAEATKQAEIAEQAKKEAEKQTQIANKKTAEANKQTAIAKDKTEEANKQTGIANEQAEIAKKAKKEADKQTLISKKKTKQAIQAQKEAKQARQDKSLAQANLNKANKDLRSAEAQKAEAEQIKLRLEGNIKELKEIENLYDQESKGATFYGQRREFIYLLTKMLNSSLPFKRIGEKPYEIEVTPQRSNQPQKSLEVSLKSGDRGWAVTDLQNQLQDMSIYEGPVTGFFGDLTKNAVTQFQSMNGITKTGVADSVTLILLQKRASIIKIEIRGGGEIAEIQKKLNEKGFNLVIDGVYGPQTISAVRKFQEENDLDSNGRVDPETRKKLGIKIKSSAGEEISALQKWLKELGFYKGEIKGEINGIKNRDTDIAIEKAKSKYGVKFDESSSAGGQK